MLFYRSGMLQEFCPDIAEYAKAKQQEKSVESSEPVPSGSVVKKDEDNMDNLLHTSSATVTSKDEVKKGSEKVDIEPVIGKRGHASASESDGHIKHDGRERKKKKQDKHCKDREQKREKDHNYHHKDKSKSAEREKSTVKMKQERPDSEDGRKKTGEKGKKDKKPRLLVMSSSSSEDGDKDTDRNRTQKRKEESSSSKFNAANQDDDSGRFNNLKLEKGADGVWQSSPKHTTKEKSPEEKERKEGPKRFSAYHSKASHITLQRWKPVLSGEHTRYAKMFRVKPCAIVCLDLLDLPILFRNPEKPSKNPNSMPLTSNLELDESHVQTIRRLERDKLTWFKGELSRQARKLKDKRGQDSSDSDRVKKKKVKRKRILLDRVDSNSNANSSASSNRPASSKKPKKTESESKSGDRGGGKLAKAKAVKEAEAKKQKLEEISKKAEKISARGTGSGVLPWEKKCEYFRKKVENANASKQRELAEEEKKKAELARREKLSKQKIVPSVPFQRILASIEAAKKLEVEAREPEEPRVELKIPNLSEQVEAGGPRVESKLKIPDLSQQQQQQKQGPPTEYKIQDEINVGDVSKEVTRLLSSDVKVEVPVFVQAGSPQERDYTVKKIAWWLLKMEKDPPDQGAFHPERHDNDDLESIHSEEDFDWPSDTSSIRSCASDPEGLDEDIPPDRMKIRDPDWLDEYCGEASLLAKVRKDTDTANITPEYLASMDGLKEFLITKPGTNYSKTNFEAKCRICDEKFKGQRQLGAHIRSDSHKENFRKFSLSMATYEENVRKPAAKKEFVAQLVEYAVNPETTNFAVGIAGDTAGNVGVHEMPIPDGICLPSREDYDDRHVASDDISLPSMEDYLISSDESLMNVKVALRTSRKWSDQLEEKWRKWEEEEAKLVEAYNKKRDFFIAEPNKHPSFQAEWLKFWEKRCIELEAEGKDPDHYDFQKEWKPFWFKRMQEIMKEQVEEKVHAWKKWWGIDKDTLRTTYNVSAEATRRKKKKKKFGRQEQGNSGSFRSSDSSPARDPRPRQQMRSLSSSQYHHQRQFDPGNHRSNNYRGHNYRDRDHRQWRNPHQSQHYRSNNQNQNRYHRGEEW